MATGGYDDEAGSQPPAPVPAPTPSDDGRVSRVVASPPVSPAASALRLAPAPAPIRCDADGVVLDDDGLVPDPPGGGGVYAPRVDDLGPNVARLPLPRPPRRGTVNYLVDLLHRHPHWEGVLGWDRERGEAVAMRPPPWGHDGPDPVGMPFVAGQALDADDFARVSAWVERSTGLDVPEQLSKRSARLAAKRRLVSPMREWVLSLPDWDRVPRLDSWLADLLGCEPGPYATELGRRWMMTLVARVMRPGTRAGRTLALIDDGKGVDVMRALCPSPGRLLEADTVSAGKDLAAVTAGRFIAYMRVDGTPRSITTALYVAERGADSYRANYEDGGTERGRSHTTVISLWENDALDDERLSRGCLPIACTIDGGAPIAMEIARDLLIAEARDRLAAGEGHDLDGDDLADMAAATGFGEIEWSPLLTAVSAYLSERRDEWVERGWVSIPGIIQNGLRIPPERASRALSTKVARVLKSLGWRRGATRLRQGVPGARAQIWPWRPSEAAMREIAESLGASAADIDDAVRSGSSTSESGTADAPGAE